MVPGVAQKLTSDSHQGRRLSSFVLFRGEEMTSSFVNKIPPSLIYTHTKKKIQQKNTTNLAT
jgi:hypothetical protein